MTFADAIAADRDGRTQDAAVAYEDALAADPRDLTSLLNLAVLYWQATDYGTSATAHLGPDFVGHAGRRFRELLETARQQFPDRPEPLFWSKYIAWTDLGEPFDVTVCRQLLRTYPDYLEPAMALFSMSSGGESESDAIRLLERCNEDRTARSRYLASVINGVLRRLRRKPSPRSGDQ